MKKNLFILLSIITLLSSCVSQKKLTYLQDNGETEVDSLGHQKLLRTD